ncbi:Xyloglucan endotransglucosylase/hydrolase protein 2-like protein [Drosera capensis]
MDCYSGINPFAAIVIFLLTHLARSTRAFGQSFDQNFQVSWGYDHFARFDNAQRIQISLDHASGSGFMSKQEYHTGIFEMKIKLAPYSEGVVTSHYLSTDSSQKVHEELDFEFLGDKILQTNVFADGVGNREQRIRLWFDAAADFHTYTIVRNPYIIVFYIDGIPVRVFKKSINKALPFLTQPLRIQASIWNGSSWAGGPISWNKSPFKAQYEGFSIHGCPASNGTQNCASPSLPWNKRHDLTSEQKKEFQMVKSKYMFYDYCNDRKRKPAYPQECNID